MSDDVLDWLKTLRDWHARQRDEAFKTDDWATGNPHDDASRKLFEAIQEIEKSREIIGIMKDVLMRRILETYGKT